ncbi:MAG: response regulator transcription factor, partial [Firmicutes bacterium]|nr:response regulator transcription factor [Bacillota bacterium]
MRIMIVDDHQIIREGLRSLLEKLPDIEIVAEAGDGITAVQKAGEISPDLVLMDISLPNLNGIEATRKITSENPGIKVIALTMHSEKWFLDKMIKAGASGYITKGCDFKELIQALISCEEENGFFLGRSIAGLVIKDYVAQLKNDHSEPALTAREREILQLIAEGKTTAEAASLLKISKKTVEAHRSRIMNKLGLYNLADLIKYAFLFGLIYALLFLIFVIQKTCSNLFSSPGISVQRPGFYIDIIPSLKAYLI